MEDKKKAVEIIKKAQEDFSSGKITRRDFNSIMMTLGAVAGYTLFNSFASAWTGTRMRKSSGVTGYQIQRSLRLRSSVNAYLTRTPSGAGDRKTFTWSCWIKRGSLSVQNILQVGGNPGGTVLYFGSDDCLHLTLYITAAETLVTNHVFRDPSAWYHIVVAVDTTQATSSNRVKIYINGSQVTSFSTINYPAQNTNVTINSTTAHTFGLSTTELAGYLDSYQSEMYFIDGQALTPASFGQTDATTGAWAAIKYTGTYGTNGFYLPFTDTSSTTNLVKDSSGNNNHWTANNISLTAGVTYDSMTDVPQTYGVTDRGNYCILNPLGGNTWNGFPIEGNLKTSTNGNASGNYTNNGTIAARVSTYFEVTIFNCNLGTGGTAGGVGYTDANTLIGANLYPGGQANSFGFMPSGGTTAWISKKNGAANTTLSLIGITNGDVIGVAYDPINGNAWVSKNGVWNGSGNPSTGASPDITGIASSNHVPAVSPYYDGATVINHICNFGQRPFAYTTPTGFKPLHSGNLPNPTILKPYQHFDISLYTGNASVRTISTDGNGRNLDLAPDLVWTKARTAPNNSHVLFDSNRGVGNYLMSSSTSAEVFNAGMLTSFNSNGFSAGADSTTAINGSGVSLVAWMWKAGGAAVSNANGSITSQVSANTTAGFSTVTYTGTGANATVGHGLGVTPKMIIVKGRTNAVSWAIYHPNLGGTAGQVWIPFDTNGVLTASTVWNNTAPTSSVFSIGVASNTNVNATTFVAYCFAEIADYSKISSYVGNGSTGGPFIYCGFRPKYIMFKRSDTTGNWNIYDTTREPINFMRNELLANTIYEENSATSNVSSSIDILSNGFKIRSSDAECNASGGTYIFMAFADIPFKYACAR